MTRKEVIVIGAGIAGFAAIKAIREEDEEISILWISHEDRLPYKRTKVNKHLATGFEKEEFALINDDWFINNKVELIYDEVKEIYPDKSELIFEHRGHIRYDKLIIATGNKPISPKNKWEAEDSILHIHTARQAENIIRSFGNSKKYAIIGGGVEGIETANQLIKKGKEVILIEKDKRVLKKYLSTSFSEYLQKKITDLGIQLLLQKNVTNIREIEPKGFAIEIDTDTYKVDQVIVSIGATPNIDLAKPNKLDHKKGILVNEFLQTSVPNIFAAGDVAQHPDGNITGLWHAAEDQGTLAGKNVLELKHKIELRKFRMKTEIFGDYYFSAPPNKFSTKAIIEDKGNIVREIYLNEENTIDGIIMRNDGERAKIYQKAVWESWTIEQLNKELPL